MKRLPGWNVRRGIFLWTNQRPKWASRRSSCQRKDQTEKVFLKHRFKKGVFWKRCRNSTKVQGGGKGKKKCPTIQEGPPKRIGKGKSYLQKDPRRKNQQNKKNAGPFVPQEKGYQKKQRLYKGGGRKNSFPKRKAIGPQQHKGGGVLPARKVHQELRKNTKGKTPPRKTKKALPSTENNKKKNTRKGKAPGGRTKPLPRQKANNPKNTKKKHQNIWFRRGGKLGSC